jgi:hypothetical protein
MACYATRVDNSILRVPLLRVSNHAHAETIARRLLWLLRERARTASADLVLIDDTHLSLLAGKAAVHESYERIDDRLLAWVINKCGTSLDITAAVSHARENAGLIPATLLKPQMPAEVAAQYERTWWPAKLTDSALPHFAVAIRPEWSATLFGTPQTLLERPDELALGREQVYYRSGRKSPLKAPGRILWFLSQDKAARRARSQDEPPASYFIGTSMLDAIETDTPEALHSTLHHYGVFSLDRIRAVTNERGLAQALRISDTELFESPVSWRQYSKLRPAYDGPKMILSPVEVPTALFAEIYALSQQRSTQPDDN